jgi:hypothetical protein
MKNLKKSIKKMRKRRRKTYKGGAAAQDNAKYISLAKQILEIKHLYPYSYGAFTPEQIQQFSVHLREKLPKTELELSDFLGLVTRTLRNGLGRDVNELHETLQDKGIIVPNPPPRQPNKSSPSPAPPTPPRKFRRVPQKNPFGLNKEDLISSNNIIAGQVLNILGYGLNNMPHKNKFNSDSLVHNTQIVSFASYIEDFDILEEQIDIIDEQKETSIETNRKILLQYLYLQGVDLIQIDKDGNYLVDKNKLRHYISTTNPDL